MRKLVFLLSFFLLFPQAYPKLKIIGKGRGDYLSYSYDKNIFYGEKVELDIWDWKFRGERVLIDFDSNVINLMGGVEVERGSKRLSGDEIKFSLLFKEFLIINYGERIEIKYFGENLEEKETSNIPFDMREIDADVVSNSFLYYTFRSMEILENLRIIGYDVISHLEGIRSIPLGKFVVKKGTINIGSGVRVGKVWYSNSQGIVMDATAVIKKKGNDISKTFLSYEEKSFLKDALEKRILRVRNDNRISLGKNWEGSIQANFDSVSSWNTNISFSKNTPSFSTNFSLYHFKSFSNTPLETWLRVDSNFSNVKIANLSFSLGYEKKGQFLSSLSLSRQIFKNTFISANSSYSFIKKMGGFEGSNIFSGTLSFRFSPKFFSLSSSYSLNNDLIRGNRLSTPSLNLEFSPIFFYSRLIQLNLSNSLFYNIWYGNDGRRTDYTDNFVMNLSTSLRTIPILKNVSFNYRVEHLWREKGEEFLTSGATLNFSRAILKNILNLSFVYNFNTRRRTKGWFIEGNNFENLSLFLNFKPYEPLSMNVSMNGEPKRGLVNSFGTFNYSLGRSWIAEVDFNYDFLIRKLANLEAYLIRDTEKFSIRIGWRMLGKQIFIDFLPK